MMMNTLRVCLVILCFGIVCILADDPISVSVGFKDGGFVGFQTSRHSPYYVASTEANSLVINHSPDDTAMELTIPDYSRFKKITTDLNSPITVAKGVETLALHESTLKTPLVKSDILNVHDSNAPFVSLYSHNVTGGALSIGGVEQWALNSFDDFSKESDDWYASHKGKIAATSVSDKRQTCGTSTDKHLGGYCAFSNIEVSKTITDLPAHGFVRVTARVHFFDNWKGEYMYAKVDDQIVWMQSHTHCTKPFASLCKGLDSCGDNKYADKMSQLVSITLPHATHDIKLTFGSSLESSPCQASWAIDDVAVYTRHTSF